MSTAEVTVRPAETTDAPAIAAIYVSSWRAAYADLMPGAYLDVLSVADEAARWDRSLGSDTDRHRTTFLAEDRQGRALGYSTVGPDIDDDSRGLLFLMYVLPEVWGAGVGACLMAVSEDALSELGYPSAVLWVLERNARARRFYERRGWHADGTRSAEDYGGVSLAALRYARVLHPRANSGSAS